MSSAVQIESNCECGEANAASGMPAAIPLKGLHPHFMLIPSLACPAECSYCFGPHRGPIMSEETMDATLEFMARIVGETSQRQVKVTFHGGEPLMASHAIWRQALDGLATHFGQQHCDLALQSNLWLLDEEFCRLFRQHKVDVGTSLDGPEEITDAQRGRGYFARTMQAVRRVQSQGMKIGCIATFTPASLPRWREVFDFFLNERLGFSIHAAVPPLDHGASRLALPPSQYAKLLCQMLDYYIEHRRELAVSSFDQMCQGFGCGEGKVCTFRDCLGMFLAIDPNGSIYPCQRFCGQPQHRLGAIQDRPTLVELFSSPTALRMTARQREVRQACHSCAHLEYCRGGCPYNAWVNNLQSEIRIPESVDPYCEAYREIFDYIQRRVAEEMAREENINAIADRSWDRRGHTLLRKGPLIELVREGPHPSRVARTAKRIIAAVELAKGPDLPTVETRLIQMGLCRTPQSAEASLKALWNDLHPRVVRLNNLYLHVTFDCQLRCTHCYAYLGRPDSPPPLSIKESGASSQDNDRRYPGAPSRRSEMSPAAIEKLIREAKEVGFQKVVITGGEPLLHLQLNLLLRTLASARSWACPMRFALRTNFALSLDDATMLHIARAFDQVIVSVDGNEQTHDARRGKGTYAAALGNLETYVRKVETRNVSELYLACVMRAADIRGAAGQAVSKLADRLGIRRPRFRPVLPLGRAQDWDEPPTSEALGAYADPVELIEDGFHPVATCGLGKNLYVKPSGEAYPCYAYRQPHSFLGNVVQIGLPATLQSERFQDLCRHSVDTNPKCGVCTVRYLCGGACRAWGGEACQQDLDAAPPECDGLRARAENLEVAARHYLGLGQNHNTEAHK